MKLDLFINFDGNCKQALEFYSAVFKTEVQGLMTYGDAPAEQGYKLRDEDKGRVMYSTIAIGNNSIMFCDGPAGMPVIEGNNITLTLVGQDKDELRRVFDALKDGGEVGMELCQTFWSEMFGMVTDKFGISWQISHGA